MFFFSGNALEFQLLFVFLQRWRKKKYMSKAKMNWAVRTLQDTSSTEAKVAAMLQIYDEVHHLNELRLGSQAVLQSGVVPVLAS
jgi:hypothetical protein